MAARDRERARCVMRRAARDREACDSNGRGPARGGRGTSTCYFLLYVITLARRSQLTLSILSPRVAGST